MGSPLVRASIAAISPSFQCSRLTCHTPSPISTASAPRARAVKPMRPLVCIAHLFGGELALFGLVPELKRDQHALERPKQNERQDKGERAPQSCVQPIRRRIENLDDQ